MPSELGSARAELHLSSTLFSWCWPTEGVTPRYGQGGLGNPSLSLWARPQVFDWRLALFCSPRVGSQGTPTS